MTHKLIPNPGYGYFVCPWCGERAYSRPGLDAHFERNEQCNRNKLVNSQTNEKNNTSLTPPKRTNNPFGLRVV